MQQQPTHPCLHLRDARDAHVVFEAVSRRALLPITRRLNETERRLLVRPGAVFVWFEAEDDSGLMRWTDGRSWGQSRMREPYLFYDEKMPYDAARAANEMNRGPAYRFIDGAPRSGPSSSAISHQDRTAYHHSGLVKQAYSAWVSVSPESRPQKWHITAYFTYADLPNLPTIDHYPYLREITIPNGKYRSSHSRTRGDHDKDDLAPGHPALSSGAFGLHGSQSSHAGHGHHVGHVGHGSHVGHVGHGSHVGQGGNGSYSGHGHGSHHGSHGHGHGDTSNPYAPLPPLAALAVCAHPPLPSPSRLPLPHGARLPEDQRLIHMLNSRHIR